MALGLASSIGLGTGLHTFVLFLGPFIARVTLTAYRCGSLDFDTRGPNRYAAKSYFVYSFLSLTKVAIVSNACPLITQ